jgi:hypothetical protein
VDVSFYNAYKFIKDIVLMFTELPKIENILEFGVNGFLDSVFDLDVNTITLAEWINYCDSNLNFADGPLQKYFRYILLNESSSLPELPILSSNSDILNRELYC